MAVLLHTFASLYTDAAELLYGHRSPSESEKVMAKRTANEGYLEFVGRHSWYFMEPQATISLFPTTGGTMAVSGTGNTTVTDLTNTPFLPSMIGQTIVSTNGSYTITAYTSSSVVTVGSSAAADNGLPFTITPDGNYALPADFSAMLSRKLTYPVNTGYAPILPSSPDEIRNLRARGNATAEACVWAVQPASFAGATGQRWMLMTWPTPGRLLAVAYQYRVDAQQMTADAEYPLGGQTHAATIQAFVMAAAEWRKTRTIDGPCAKQAEKMLAVSLRRDADQRPATLGRMAPGERRPVRHDPNDWRTAVTVE